MQDDDVVLHQKFNFISFFVSSALLSFSLTKCTTRLLISANFSRNFLFKSYEMKQNLLELKLEQEPSSILEESSVWQFLSFFLQHATRFFSFLSLTLE